MRTNYRNGDEISLSCGCDGCSPSMINGVLCHESGCPDAWKDRPVSCFECGCQFYRTESIHQRNCSDCSEPNLPDEDDTLYDAEGEELQPELD
jgi:hypothetical protein